MKISQVTIATTNTDKMAEFYRSVFSTELTSFEAMGTLFYKGDIAGLHFMLCPNSIAGVEAKQNRHQFDYDIGDLDNIVERSIASGGSVQGEITEGDKYRFATIIDPDGNTMNFYQSKK